MYGDCYQPPPAFPAAYVGSKKELKKSSKIVNVEIGLMKKELAEQQDLPKNATKEQHQERSRLQIVSLNLKFSTSAVNMYSLILSIAKDIEQQRPEVVHEKYMQLMNIYALCTEMCETVLLRHSWYQSLRNAVTDWSSELQKALNFFADTFTRITRTLEKMTKYGVEISVAAIFSAIIFGPWCAGLTTLGAMAVPLVIVCSLGWALFSNYNEHVEYIGNPEILKAARNTYQWLEKKGFTDLPQLENRLSKLVKNMRKIVPAKKISSCAICLEDELIDPARPNNRACQHTFCHKCITAALKSSKSCPICRRLASRSLLVNTDAE